VRGSVEVKAACVRPGASARRLPTVSRQRRQRTTVSSVSKAALCQWAEVSGLNAVTSYTSSARASAVTARRHKRHLREPAGRASAQYGHRKGVARDAAPRFRAVTGGIVRVAAASR